LRIPAKPVCFTVEARGPLIFDPPITLCDFVAAPLRSGEARMDTSLNVAMASSVTPAEYKTHVVITEATGGPCSRTWPVLDSNEPTASTGNHVAERAVLAQASADIAKRLAASTALPVFRKDLLPLIQASLSW
jgi:hypothetical protein